MQTGIFFGIRVALAPPRTAASVRRLAGCGASYVEVMVGKLRARVARAADARGTWITFSLLLASTLLGGCNQSTTTGDAATQPTATAQPGSAAAQTQAPAAATQTAPESTQATSPGTQAAAPPPAAKSVDISWSAPTTNT